MSSVLLSRKRLRYAWIAGGALWAGWLVSLLAGRHGLDLAGQVIGGDYLQFYAAGATLRLGESPRLYDMAYQFHLQQQIIGPSLTNYYAFITPPFLAWLYEPLSALPFRLSFALWSLFGLAALWCSIRLVGGVESGGGWWRGSRGRPASGVPTGPLRCGTKPGTWGLVARPAAQTSWELRAVGRRPGARGHGARRTDPHR